MNSRIGTIESQPASLRGLLTYEQGLGVASVILTGLIFCLISLGGLVRNAGAGLSCPDWPLCYGRVVPPMNYQVFLEWFHRLIAGSVSTFLIGLTAAILWKPELRAKLWKYCALALSLLAMQIVLGGLTVLGLLNPKWVSSHLAVGLAFFGTILMLTLEIRDLHRTRVRTSGHKGLIAFATITASILYLQMLLGGLVSSNYAGLACPDFPTCFGKWIPSFVGLVRFQFMHRVGATAATISIVGLLVAVWATRELHLSRRARFALLALPGFLTLQILLGVGSVLFKLPLPMSVAHLGTAAALFGMLLVTNYEIRRS
jgi:cytochrome c oxidase assembly protein subunit 15